VREGHRERSCRRESNKWRLSAYGQQCRALVAPWRVLGTPAGASAYAFYSFYSMGAALAVN
jgi:hypothetical protein